jgi:hypothetical protein
MCRYLFITFILILLGKGAYANDVNGDFSNNYQDSTVDSGNASTTNNYNAAGAASASPVMSAISPTMMGGGGNDSCLLPTTSGIQVTMFGFSQGTMQQDEHCNRRKNARLLGAPQQVGGLGLQVSAISVLCSSPATPKSEKNSGQSVFKSMMLASTPCPIMDVVTGKILMGKDAIDKYRQHPQIYIVGYETDKEFWDTLLRIGEDLSNEENKAKVASNSRDTRSISERFRTTRRVTSTTRIQPDGRTENNGTEGND